MTAGPRHTHAAPCSSKARTIRKDDPGLPLTENNPEGSRPTGSRPRRPETTAMENQTTPWGVGRCCAHRTDIAAHLAIGV